jgi:hypothetical protein
VTRGIALNLRTIHGDVPQFDHARRRSQLQDLDKHADKGIQVELAEIADRAKVRTILPNNGEEGQIAFAGQGNLAAGENADAVAIEQQTHHLGRVKWRGAPSFILVVAVEPR